RSHSLFRATAGKTAGALTLAISRYGGKPAVALPARHCRTARRREGWLANRSSRVGPCERRLVAREGLEPSKPQGRQIYSLLRLTASLPRQLCVIGMRCFRRVPCGDSSRSMELAKGFEPPTC